MSSIQIHRRASSKGKEYVGSLFIRVIHERKYRSVTLPFRLYREEWDSVRQCIRRDNIEPFREDYLRLAEKEITRALGLLWQIYEEQNEKGCFTAHGIVERYRAKVSGGQVIPFVRQVCEEMRSEGQESSVCSYNTAVKRFQQFMAVPRLTFRQITAEELLRFEKSLLAEGLERNTSSSYMRSLRAIYNKAAGKGLVDKNGQNPFSGVFTGVEPTRKRSLTKEELHRIANWRPEDYIPLGTKGHEESVSAPAKIDRVRRYFLFSVLAQGMPFVDMAYLRKDSLSGNTVSYRRHKTAQPVEVSLTPESLEILASFEDETRDSPYLFPIIPHPGEDERRQYENALRLYNKWLKRLQMQLHLQTQLKIENQRSLSEAQSNGQLAKADLRLIMDSLESQQAGTNCQLLSSYAARHSWATLAKQQNLPIGVISECLGHTSEKTTRIYLGKFDREIIAAANQKIAQQLISLG